jgi:transposase-like protein
MWLLLEGEVVAMPRPYPPEFRQRALDLVRSGRPVPEVAKLLGIAESCLYRWKKQDLVDRGLKPATVSAELTAARRKIRELEEENKILRKAAAAVEEVVPPKDRYRLVAELHADGVRVRQACLLLPRRVHLRVLRVEDPGAFGPVDPARLADRPDRAGARCVLRHLRPAEGPGRAPARARRHG